MEVYYIFSALNLVALFIAAHAYKWVWYILAFLGFLMCYFLATDRQEGSLSVCVPAAFICVLALSVWSDDEEVNREGVTWGSPMLALLESFVVGGLLYIFFHQTFRVPIFECMGSGSLIVGIYLLCWGRVSAWIILIYSFVMYAIASFIFGNMRGGILMIAQVVLAVYGLTRYMEYYEDNKLKELKK